MYNIIFKPSSSDEFKSLKSPINTAKKMMQYFFEDRWKDITENPNHKHSIGNAQKIIYGMSKNEGEEFRKWFNFQHKFWEFKESSTRATIGNALESILSISVGKDKTLEVGKKKAFRNKLIKEILSTDYNFKEDIDLGIKKGKNDILLFQLRSKDDTGGTTAKASNVVVLRDIMEKKESIIKGSKCLYLIGVWDGRQSSQKMSMITKCYQYLKPYLANSITKEYFIDNMEDPGINILPEVKLKLVYDIDNISKEIGEWSESIKRGIDISKTLNNNLESVQNFDDFFIIFTCLSFELQNYHLNKIDNFLHLEHCLQNEKFEDPINEKNYLSEANRLSEKIFKKWNHSKNKTPFKSKSYESKQYIRDLILIKFAYQKSQK